ncbi:uncharacterized protein JCM6883_002256 [Sporobolomyces salmoneus]|uniref:uncharacterized protein n=1 Tax=Sporobolomyces salmoneus TaxID=183962 RepID=UPI00316C41C1
MDHMGYDTDLFITVEDWAVCNICHDIIDVATLSGCRAEHIFCRACIEQIPAYSGCPSCRGPSAQAGRRESVLANRLIQNFPVKCDRAGVGCSWTGTAPQLLEHVASECAFTNVNCPRQCGNSYKRFKEKEHEEVCNAWPCTVTEGCRTKTTKRFLKKHEGQCKQQSQQLTATKKKLKNVKSELRRKRKTEAKRVAKAEGNAPEGGGGPDEGGPKLIPTGHDQDSAESSNGQNKGKDKQTSARETGETAGDGDQAMKVDEETEASSSRGTLKKRKRAKKGSKANNKAKENQACSMAGQGGVGGAH